MACHDYSVGQPFVLSSTECFSAGPVWGHSGDFSHSGSTLAGKSKMNSFVGLVVGTGCDSQCDI